MKPSMVMMMARKVWPLKSSPPVAHSRRREIMLAFRPSPEIPGFNLHYLAAARMWMKENHKSKQEDIGHIRKAAVSAEEAAEAQKRLDSLPESLKKEMEALWKDTSNDKKHGGLWVREEVRRSRFGDSMKMVDYWETAIKLSKEYLVDGPKNLMKIMEEGGFLDPNKEHDCKELHSYMERRLGKRVYITFKYRKDLKINTLDGVFVLFDVADDNPIDHPNQVQPGKFRVSRCDHIYGGAATGDTGEASGGEDEGCSHGGGSGSN